MTAALLNIAALSRRTGVAPDTLRKWEQRYGVLRPVRTAGGQRRYSEMDVQRVEWLRDRIRDGWRIGEAARVIDEATSVALDEPSDLRDTLIAAIEENDPRAVSATLDQAFAVLRLEQALAEVVTPALQWAGDAWHRGELSVAQEHAITAKVRAHLGKLISEGRGGVRGSAVLACAPGEHHDIGLLMLAVMLRADGGRVPRRGHTGRRRGGVRRADRGRDALPQRVENRVGRRAPGCARRRRASGLMVIVVGGAA